LRTASSLPLFQTQYVEEQAAEKIAPLPLMPQGEHVLADYRMLRLSLRAHLMQFLRDLFRGEGVMSCAEVSNAADGARASCAGIVLTRQMPGDAGGVFITLSDETSVANVVVWPRLVEKFRRAIMGGRLLLVEGKIQRSPEHVVHLVAERIFDRTEELDRISEDETETTVARPRQHAPAPPSAQRPHRPAVTGFSLSSHAEAQALHLSSPNVGEVPSVARRRGTSRAATSPSGLLRFRSANHLPHIGGGKEGGSRFFRDSEERQ